MREGSSVFQISASEAQLLREAQHILEPYGLDVFVVIKELAPLLEQIGNQTSCSDGDEAGKERQ